MMDRESFSFVLGDLGGRAQRIWMYAHDTDDKTAITAPGYFKGAEELGVREGDSLLARLADTEVVEATFTTILPNGDGSVEVLPSAAELDGRLSDLEEDSADIAAAALIFKSDRRTLSEFGFVNSPTVDQSAVVQDWITETTGEGKLAALMPLDALVSGEALSDEGGIIVPSGAQILGHPGARFQVDTRWRGEYVPEAGNLTPFAFFKGVGWTDDWRISGLNMSVADLPGATWNGNIIAIDGDGWTVDNCRAVGQATFEGKYMVTRGRSMRYVTTASIANGSSILNVGGDYLKLHDIGNRVEIYGAKESVYTGGAMASGSKVLEVGGTPFRDWDVGTVVVVPGAAAGGGALTTVIAAVTSTNTVQLHAANASGGAVSSASVTHRGIHMTIIAGLNSLSQAVLLDPATATTVGAHCAWTQFDDRKKTFRDNTLICDPIQYFGEESGGTLRYEGGGNLHAIGNHLQGGDDMIGIVCGALGKTYTDEDPFTGDYAKMIEDYYGRDVRGVLVEGLSGGSVHGRAPGIVSISASGSEANARDVDGDGIVLRNSIKGVRFVGFDVFTQDGLRVLNDNSSGNVEDVSFAHGRIRCRMGTDVNTQRGLNVLGGTKDILFDDVKLLDPVAYGVLVERTSKSLRAPLNTTFRDVIATKPRIEVVPTVQVDDAENTRFIGGRYEGGNSQNVFNIGRKRATGSVYLMEQVVISGVGDASRYGIDADDVSFIDIDAKFIQGTNVAAAPVRLDDGVLSARIRRCDTAGYTNRKFSVKNEVGPIAWDALCEGQVLTDIYGSATELQLLDPANAINTTNDKRAGAVVIDTTWALKRRARGNADGDVFDAVGELVSKLAPVVLNVLTLSNSTIAAAPAQGTVVGAILGLTGGSTRQIPDSANNRFAISGTDVVAGTNAASIAAATVYNITLRETLNGITKDTPLTVTVP
jgi:hypothetical protein